MRVRAFLGGAGCGKTYQLMLTLTTLLNDDPLKDGQRVLALTFMHGSRRRLTERLKSVPGLLHKHECSTVDSFAWRIVCRWRSLVQHLGFQALNPDAYEEICSAAGALIELDIVAKWVTATFPILIVDEAQDLCHARLRIVVALAKHLDVLIAADEFQCLDEQLKPNPAYTWLATTREITELTAPRRTKVPALLEAANAIRSGKAPASSKFFTIVHTPNVALAGTWLTNAVGWYAAGNKIAVITPADVPFARSVVEWVGVNKTKQGCGPYKISWEQSESSAAAEFVNKLPAFEADDSAHILGMLQFAENPRVTTDVLNWMDIQRRALGREVFTKDEIISVVKKSFSTHRRRQQDNAHGYRAMTVHGAKNREFDNVIVLWPAAVAGSDDQKRRLLYNALTRAKQRCLVLVQAKISLGHPPFVE